MAKSPRTGGNRGRRAAERRTAPEAAATPEQVPSAADDRGAVAAVAGAASAGPAARPRPRVVTRQQIAARAYEIYTARGGAHGSDLEDWLQAERELRSK